MTTKHHLTRANECVAVILFEMTTPFDLHYIAKQTRADDSLVGDVIYKPYNVEYSTRTLTPDLADLSLWLSGFQASRHDLIIWPCT